MQSLLQSRQCKRSLKQYNEAIKDYKKAKKLFEATKRSCFVFCKLVKINRKKNKEIEEKLNKDMKNNHQTKKK